MHEGVFEQQMVNRQQSKMENETNTSNFFYQWYLDFFKYLIILLSHTQ